MSKYALTSCLQAGRIADPVVYGRYAGVERGSGRPARAPTAQDAGQLPAARAGHAHNGCAIVLLKNKV